MKRFFILSLTMILALTSAWGDDTTKDVAKVWSFTWSDATKAAFKEASYWAVKNNVCTYQPKLTKSSIKYNGVDLASELKFTQNNPRLGFSTSTLSLPSSTDYPTIDLPNLEENDIVEITSIGAYLIPTVDLSDNGINTNVAADASNESTSQTYSYIVKVAGEYSLKNDTISKAITINSIRVYNGSTEKYNWTFTSLTNDNVTEINNKSVWNWNSAGVYPKSDWSRNVSDFTINGYSIPELDGKLLFYGSKDKIRLPENAGVFLQRNSTATVSIPIKGTCDVTIIANKGNAADIFDTANAIIPTVTGSKSPYTFTFSNVPSGTFSFRNSSTSEDITITSITVPKYALLTIKEVENGTMTVGDGDIKVGDEITITCTPNADCFLEEGSLEAYYYENEVKKNCVIDQNGKFIMPAADVTITASFSATTEISSVEIAGLSAPVKGEVLKVKSDLSTTTTGASISSISWSPEGTTAAGNTSYTATVVMTANDNYQFAENVTANEIGGKTGYVTRTDATHISVVYTFDATETEQEASVSTEKTWVFGGLTSGTEYKAVTSPNNEYYLRGANNDARKITVTAATSATYTFADGTAVSENTDKILSLSGGLSAGSGFTGSTSFTAGEISSDATPSFAFNTSVAGTVYAKIKGTANDKLRIWYADGKNTPKYHIFTATGDVDEIAYTSSSGGSFFITDMTNACEIYTVRFVPASVERATVSTAKNLTFNDKSLIGTTSVVYIGDGMYMRGYAENAEVGGSNRSMGITSLGESTNVTLNDETISVSKVITTYASFQQTTEDTKDASSISTSAGTPTVAVKTTLPGKLYVAMSPVSDGNGASRIYFGNGTDTPREVSTSDRVTLSTAGTIYYANSTSTEAGTFFVGANVACKIYALRFEPESMTIPTIKNNNGTITITDGTSSIGATVKTYYTTNGNEPTSGSTLYSGTFAYPAECTQIKAITISDLGTSSEVVTKTVPTIPTALSSNSINFAGLETSAVTVDDEDNYTIDTENKKYTTGSAIASTLYINNVSFTYSTSDRFISLGAYFLICNGSGLTITIPGLASDDIVILSSSSNNSSAVTFSCTSGGEILSGATTSIQTDPTNLIVKSTGGNMVLTTTAAGLRLYSITVCKSLAVSVAEGQSEYGSAAISTGTVASNETTNYYTKGGNVTVVATPGDGYYFVEWKNGETQVSTSAEYTFALNEDMALTAYFAAKTAPTVTTAPAAVENLSYTGAAQNLVTAGDVTGGTIYYSTTSANADDFSATIPTGIDAGNYTVWYKVVGDASHTDTDVAQIDNIIIAKATLALDGALTATGTYGLKLNEITDFTGTVKIEGTEIGVEGTWAIDGETIPDVGTYADQYTAVFTPTQAEGKDNYNALDAQNVTLTITQVAATINPAPTGATGLTYNGTPQQIINATNAVCVGGELLYCKTSDGEFTSDASTITETNAGTYSFYYKVVADGNHTGIEPVEVTGIQIAKYNIANSTAEAAIEDQSYTGSQITPAAPAIKMGDTVIEADNYEVTYGENINAGNNAGSVIYTAKNESTNFSGTMTLTFNIIGVDLTFIGTLSATASYGTQVKDITVSTENKVTFGETEIEGTWSFSANDNDVLQVGNTIAKTATFLPTTNAGNYNALTREVTPSITTVPLTIKAKDQTIWAGDNISQEVSQVDVTGLVNNDELTSITLTASTTEVTTEGTITPSNAIIKPSASNYNITYETGNLTINAIPTYTITGVAVDGHGNSVAASAESAKAGTEITLTITVAANYSLSSISANNNVTLSGTGNTRTFTMPAANVTISATFTEVTQANANTQVTENVAIADENNATVTSVEIGASTTSVTISASINGVPVTSIADNAFSGVTNKSDIKSIDLSATSITGVTVDRSNGVFNGFPEETMIYIPLGNTAADEQKNVIINGTCSDFQMTDTKSYSIPTGFTADKATLKRSFTSDKYCTVCLPYAMTEAEANAAGTFYYFSGISGDNVQMTQKTGGLEANVPYIFVPSSNANSITATGSISVSMSNAPQTENTDANFTFKGVYGKKEFSSSEISSGVYGFAASPDYGASIGQFVKASTGAWVEGMRAYLAYNGTLTDVASTRGTRTETLPEKLNVVLVNAKGDTTNIGRLELMTAEDGSAIYNLNGQRVDKSYKGIVIKNGKKVVMK